MPHCTHASSSPPTHCVMHTINSAAAAAGAAVTVVGEHCKPSPTSTPLPHHTPQRIAALLICVLACESWECAGGQKGERGACVEVGSGRDGRAYSESAIALLEHKGARLHQSFLACSPHAVVKHFAHGSTHVTLQIQRTHMNYIQSNMTLRANT